MLFIVSRDQHDLHDYLTKEFVRDEQIQVILDRRLGDRRKRAQSQGQEHRHAPRRRALAVQEQVRSVGFAVVRQGEGASA